MIDFKKLREEKFKKLPKEEQEKILKRKKLEEENIFYQTNTTIIDEYMFVHHNKPIEKKEIPVKLYRPVDNDLNVGDRILLCFLSNPWEYGFDEIFTLSLLENCKESTKKYGLCVDAYQECYILKEEVRRIIEECLDALKSKNIPLVKDYYPSTN